MSCALRLVLDSSDEGNESANLPANSCAPATTSPASQCLIVMGLIVIDVTV
jgi:hypothetical protein